MKTKIGERGQIVIPKEIRDKLELEKGMTLEIKLTEDNGSIVMRPLRKQRKDWREWVGAFEGENLAQQYLAEKRKEKEKESKWKR